MFSTVKFTGRVALSPENSCSPPCHNNTSSLPRTNLKLTPALQVPLCGVFVITILEIFNVGVCAFAEVLIEKKPNTVIEIKSNFFMML